MPKQTPAQPPKAPFRIHPAVSALILILVMLVAWVAVKRASRTPAPGFAPPEAPASQASGQKAVSPADKASSPTLTGAITYKKDNALTVMARKADNQELASDRMLIVSLTATTLIENASGTPLAAKDLKTGAVIKVYNTAPYNDEPVLFAEKVVVTK